MSVKPSTHSPTTELTAECEFDHLEILRPTQKAEPIDLAVADGQHHSPAGSSTGDGARDDWRAGLTERHHDD